MDTGESSSARSYVVIAAVLLMGAAITVGAMFVLFRIINLGFH